MIISGTSSEEELGEEGVLSLVRPDEQRRVGSFKPAESMILQQEFPIVDSMNSADDGWNRIQDSCVMDRKGLEENTTAANCNRLDL